MLLEQVAFIPLKIIRYYVEFNAKKTHCMLSYTMGRVRILTILGGVKIELNLSNNHGRIYVGNIAELFIHVIFK